MFLWDIIAVGMVLMMAALMVALHLQRRLPDVAEPPIPDLGAVFLFDGADLADVTPQAQALIAPFADMPDRDAVYHALVPHFPSLQAIVQDADHIPQRLVHVSDPQISAQIDWPNGNLRISVDGLAQTAQTAPDQAEFGLLRDIAAKTPQLIWLTDQSGRIAWANQTYLAFWDQMQPDKQVDLAEKSLFALPALSGAGPSLRRMAVEMPQRDAQHWFDVTSMAHHDGALHFAADANAAVRTDQDRRNLVQTLGKTFAELSTGLAIFDKKRQLTMFNPALLDMTRLGFEFLSTRPSIDTVLDRLRESRILPEPKNYASWRDQFSAVENGAKAGTYREIWNQPDGQVFRVTGRPHPDGAFAFLFEDITADLSLTRRFRSDIETGQAVLDTLPDAIAVFSTAGTLVMYNRGYAQLWGGRADQGLEHRELRMEMAQWRAQCVATTLWQDLTQMMQRSGARKPWSDDVTLHDGRSIRCYAHPIGGGMTMLRFAPTPRSRTDLRGLTRHPPPIRTAKG
jgi:PAS domain-containing protein